MARRIGIILGILFITGGVAIAEKVKIDRVDYSEGDGFVQLFLPTQQIMPIPDTIYPEEGNRLNVVFRIKDSECSVDAAGLPFPNSHIRNLRIANENEYSDISLQLAQSLQPQIFSNQQGIYIKFPLNGSSQPEELAELEDSGKESIEMPPESSIPENQALAVKGSGEKGGINTLRDIRISEKTDESIVFDIILSKTPEYSLIPIPQEPARLAIDLKNTQARSVRKPIGSNDIKMIRGGCNSSSVYRVVFDLKKMKPYQVSQEGNMLRVMFGEKTSVAAANLVSPEPSRVASDKPLPSVADSKPAAPAASVSSTKESEKQVLHHTQPIQKSESIKNAVSKKDFFGPEKAKSEGERMSAGSGYMTIQDEQGKETTTYMTQTVDEGRPRYSGEPYDFIFKDADLIDVLKIIARTAGLNMAIDPDVSGKVTCEFIQVPWDQALEMFLKVNGLDMVLEGNVLRIGKVDKLAQEAQRRRQLKEAREQEINLVVVTRTLSFAKADKVKAILDKQLSPRGEIIVDVRTNLLIISDVPDRIALIDRLLDTLDAANPQVQIEARIVEAQTDYLNTFGIQWGYQAIADPTYGNSPNLIFPRRIFSTGYVPEGTAPNKYKVNDVEHGFAINVPTADTAIFPAIRLGNLSGTFVVDVFLSALERKGKGRIISAPKATTQNNMRAKVSQGEKIPIQTIQNNTVTTQYVNASLDLEVTPQITAKGSVIMDIKLANDIANFEKQVGGIPTISTEQAETVVMVNDGSTIVIGGLYKLAQSHATTGVPVLSRLPLLGNLFRNKRTSNEQRELIIFITPRIIK